MIARCHPDSGGDHELFVFAQSVREQVQNGLLIRGEFVPSAEPPSTGSKPRPKAPPRTDPSPITFDTELTFDELTEKAVATAPDLQQPYRWLFELLADVEAPGPDSPAYTREEAARGACHRRMAKVGRLLGLDSGGRGWLYHLARQVPLSDLHVRRWLEVVDDEGRRP